MSVLEEIKPTRQSRVMDLVAEAGHDVSDWANYSRGPEHAAVNPKYCYSWAFAQPGRPPVVTLWYDTMREQDGTVVKAVNMREHRKQWEGEPGKGVLAARARAWEEIIEAAYQRGESVRVIVCDRNPTRSVTRAQRRLLDRTPWAITLIDSSTGAVVLTRGATPERYVDQFSSAEAIGALALRKPFTGERLIRSRQVRERVLDRAQGKCELCGARGFRTVSGGIYLETHHVIPVASNGVDHDSNVVALCPNDHRRAHEGADRDEIARRLTTYLEQQQNRRISRAHR